jgi:L-threonylcarbamoyladenylate synthase
MNTDVLTVDQSSPDPDIIKRAAKLIQTGRLVAFPTETVYGLGANALDSEAVRGIFNAKGRPASNPIIVHVADAIQVVNVVKEWPETAQRLASRFWPGPLTIVVSKRPELPDVVTAGGHTVAVRCPDHAIAQALIRAANLPIAAPSANRSTELSPTRAEHVVKSLNGRIDMILDGGSCPGGIESTVVDVTYEKVRLLRPGLITVSMLQEVVGDIMTMNDVAGVVGVARSPGLMTKHYSPRTALHLDDVGALDEHVQEAVKVGKRVGVAVFRGVEGHWPEVHKVGPIVINLTDDPLIASSKLYEALHLLDQSQLDLILVEKPPETPEWAAIRDRLERAAAFEG